MDPLDPLNRAAAKIHIVLKTRQTSSRSCLQLERQTKSLLLMLLLKALVPLLTLLWLRSFYAKIVEPALGSSNEFLVLAVGALRRIQTCTIFSKHSLYQKLLHILLSRSVYFTLFLFLSRSLFLSGKLRLIHPTPSASRNSPTSIFSLPISVSLAYRPLNTCSHAFMCTHLHTHTHTHTHTHAHK